MTISENAAVTADGYYPALEGNTAVEITGGVVEATSGNDCGIFTPGTLTISENAAVTAKGYYPALRGNTAVKITGGVVEATSVNDCGIFTPGTLTISENASVTADGYYAALRGDTAVEITGGVVEATSVDDCGISSKDGYLAITGGTVKATSENWISIFANVGDINISDTADVTATSTNGWAVYTNSGITVSDSAKLYAQTSAQDPDHGRAAVYGNTIEISENADVTAKAAMYQAIVAAKSASITGGTVQDEAVDTAIWVQNNGALQISNATVTAISSDSMAISAQGNITVSEGSNVTATSSTDAGLFSMTGEISISDSQVSATCGGSDKAAILGNNSISIDHSNVQVGGAGSGVYTSGQEVSSSGESGNGMTIPNSVIKADTPPNQWGIHGENTGTTVTDSWLDLPASDNLASGGNSNSVTNSVMFEGNTGKVYGTAQVPDDVEVPEGKTLSVGEGTSLIVQDKTTLTNKGTVSVATTGTVTNEGTFVGDIQNTGTTTNNGIIQGSVTGEGSITNNGGITQGSDSLQVTSTEALQNVIHESVGKTEAVVITLTTDVTKDLTIPVNANVVIDGDNQYKINGVITCETSTISTDVTNLTLQNLTLDGQNSSSMAVVSQNVGSGSPVTLPGVNRLNLTMSRCTVQNYLGKALYLTNVKELKIDGCTFQDNATDQAGTSGDNDYTIDLNLCGVEETEASITNSTFTGNCGNQAVIHMAVRGGESDEGENVPLNSTEGNASASAKSLTISGCTFRDTPAAANDVNIGTDSKKSTKDDGTGAFTTNTTGDYAVTISNNKTAVTVFDASKTYKDDGGNYMLAQGNGTTKAEALEVPANRTATKTADGNLTIESNHSGVVVVPEPEEPEEPEESEQLEESKLPFADVTESAWYYEAVKYVYENNLMVGTADDTFSPGATLSRAMVAQILYNLEGQPAVTEGNTFTDSGTHWAAKAIAWAQKAGVVSGYENNTFQPNKAVTREELAQMLYNYATYKKITLPALGDLSKFPDGSKVSSWAQNAMSWATGLQVINGYEDDTLRPGGNTTRAEAASMIKGLATTLTK